MRMEIEMKMSTTPGQDETDDSDWETSDEDDSDWDSMEEYDIEARATSEKDRNETDDPDWETRDDWRTRNKNGSDWDTLDEDEIKIGITSDKVRTGYPGDTMEEEIQRGKVQGVLMTKEDVTLDRIKKTFIVITAMEKGKPRAKD